MSTYQIKEPSKLLYWYYRNIRYLLSRKRIEFYDPILYSIGWRIIDPEGVQYVSLGKGWFIENKNK